MTNERKPMTNTQTTPYGDWVGRTAVDPDGEKVGKIHDVYADDTSGQPEWLALTTGFFGTRVSLVPLAAASMSGDEVCVAYGKDLIKDSPHVDAAGHLTSQEEQQLFAHYRMGGVGNVERDTTDRSESDDRGTDEAMTRSEEELAVGTRTTEAGRARLRKWVETEHVADTVPVSHEEVRIVREPITEDTRVQAQSGDEISSAEHEVVLHAEEVVVEKRVVPKERVRLDTETVTEDVPVEAEIRKERIETEGDLDRDRR
jgi:uncharacterized protein (TIGR02271 family)